MHHKALGEQGWGHFKKALNSEQITRMEVVKVVCMCSMQVQNVATGEELTFINISAFFLEASSHYKHIQSVWAASQHCYLKKFASLYGVSLQSPWLIAIDGPLLYESV